jgi:uncharacterized protein YndB with AHSA1/START domain
MKAEQSIKTEKEMIFSRIVNAPRELVFDVWTNQEHVEKWWGPDGFRTTSKKFELKPEGVWLFTMHGPDGVDYPNKIVFMEIKRPEKLVYRHSDDEWTVPVRFHVEVTFEEENGKTLITMHSIFETAEMLTKVAEEYGAYEGAIQHLARLRDYLEALQS